MTPLTIPGPNGWRKGQTLVRFIEWLITDKDRVIFSTRAGADNIETLPDEELDKLWAEYSKPWNV
jgi:uncharacterized protein CbrC (UPF0167 family)